jgi:hypothetical protein
MRAGFADRSIKYQATFYDTPPILPEAFAPIWYQGRVSCRVLDVATAEVSLQRMRINAVIRQLAAADLGVKGHANIRPCEELTERALIVVSVIERMPKGRISSLTS